MGAYHPDDHLVVDLSKEHPLMQIKNLLEKHFPHPNQRAGVTIGAFFFACKEMGLSKDAMLAEATRALTKLELGAKL